MVLPFKGAQKHLQKGVCQNWTFTEKNTSTDNIPVHFFLCVYLFKRYVLYRKVY